MSIVCEHTSYMGQNFTHSGNHEHEVCVVIVGGKKLTAREGIRPDTRNLYEALRKTLSSPSVCFASKPLLSIIISS